MSIFNLLLGVPRGPEAQFEPRTIPRQIKHDIISLGPVSDGQQTNRPAMTIVSGHPTIRDPEITLFNWKSKSLRIVGYPLARKTPKMRW